MGIKKILRRVFATAMAMWFAVPALAVDGIAIEAGHASPTDMWRLGAQWQWPKRWLQGGNWHVGGYWDLAAGRWERDGKAGTRPQLTDLGLTPVFRLRGNELHGPYLEAGIGIHWLSTTQLGDKRFGSNFQFGDHLGFGYRFGAGGAMDIGYRFQHLSNANLAEPNDGININQLRLQYWFK